MVFCLFYVLFFESVVYTILEGMIVLIFDIEDYDSKLDVVLTGDYHSYFFLLKMIYEKNNKKNPTQLYGTTIFGKIYSVYLF